MPTASGHTKAIRATKVTGSHVYDNAGEKIGKIEDVVLDKSTNKIMFAVMSVGGAVTTSENHYAVPWSVLDFSEEKDGYVMPCNRDQVSKGPSDLSTDLTKNDGAKYRELAYKHYGVAKDW